MKKLLKDTFKDSNGRTWHVDVWLDVPCEYPSRHVYRTVKVWTWVKGKSRIISGRSEVQVTEWKSKGFLRGRESVQRSCRSEADQIKDTIKKAFENFELWQRSENRTLEDAGVKIETL